MAREGVRPMARDLLTLSRPRFWLYLAGPVLVGLAYAADDVGALLSLPAVVLFVYFLVPANVFLYGVNDRFDAAVDAANPKKGEGGRERRWRDDPVVSAAIVVSGLLVLVVAAVTPPVAWPALAAWWLLSVGYSAPPLRFKTTPLLDSVSNGLYVLPGVVAYAALAGETPPTLAVVGGWLWTMGMHTYSAVPDIDPDREAGIRTTATVLGESRTLAYCGACWVAAAVAFGALDVRLGALLAAYPLFLAGTVAAGVDVDRAYWWFPVLNGLVGMVLTVGGLGRLVGVLG